MSTQATPHSHAQRSIRSLLIRALDVRFGTLGALALFSLLLSIGCGGGGGGASPTATEEVATAATAPVDLAPGQTTAELAWTPSEGRVVGYLVFQSHDEGTFAFLSQVTNPKIQITGVAGDSIRILVVALGAADSQSVSSLPSPPIRFHAAAGAVSSLAAVGSVEATVTAAPTTATMKTQAQLADVELDTADEMQSEVASNDTQDENDEVAPLDRATRERLLASNARLPFQALSPGASQWIQSFVDVQVGAGVSLAGSGELGGDALRELIWIDSSGQLFVSDGARLATSDDLPATFVEAIRLRPTERFAGLADFDGDGVGDWIVADRATGDIWILNGENHGEQFSHLTAENPDLRLVGHGDFDGDGQAELLWRHTNSSLQLAGPTATPSVIEWTLPGEDSSNTLDAAHATSELLTVADLNGDGRDDLLFRGLDGFLELAISLPDSSGLRFEWLPGPETTTDGLELIATLDFDRDGTAEIAWWSGEALEIWDLRSVF